MLDNLKHIIDGLQALNTEQVVIDIVEDNKERISELQQEQLAAGVDISGQQRIDGYRPLTIQIKKERGVGLGAVTDRVTFFMTGKLYDSLHTQVNGPQFQVESPLPTYDKMIDRIGPENYGLSPDQREEFATEITLPQFAIKLEEKTTIRL